MGSRCERARFIQRPTESEYDRCHNKGACMALIIIMDTHAIDNQSPTNQRQHGCYSHMYNV